MGVLRPLAAMAFCLALAPTAALAQDANDNLNAVLWMQKSVEYKANAEAVFALAKIRLDQALKDKSWTRRRPSRRRFKGPSRRRARCR